MVRNTISTDEIVAGLNRRADTLAPKLLPNVKKTRMANM